MLFGRKGALSDSLALPCTRLYCQSMWKWISNHQRFCVWCTEGSPSLHKFPRWILKPCSSLSDLACWNINLRLKGSLSGRELCPCQGWLPMGWARPWSRNMHLAVLLFSYYYQLLSLAKSFLQESGNIGQAIKRKSTQEWGCVHMERESYA